MKIGILGTGGVGRTLAAKLNSLGHEIVIGTRNVEDTLARTSPDGMGAPPFKVWHSQNPKVKLVKFSEAASFGEVLFLATFGDKTAEAISLAGKQNFDNKVVVDVTNPLDFSQGVPPKFTVTLGNSLGEQIQKQISNAKVVKAFNTIGAHIIVNPMREEGSPDLFIAGNDDDAKKKFIGLAEQMGWQSVIDLGDISQAFWLEANAMLWINYGFKYNSWNHAFKLLKK